MSRMMLRSNGKPPLARSPVRLRPRRKPLQPTNCIVVQTPPGSLIKSQLPTPNRAIEKPELWPDYSTISCELRALAEMVHQEVGPNNDTPMVNGGPISPPLFERGRFYDEYSARRNERLTRKKGEMEKKPSYGLGVRVESAKKRESAGKFEGRRKSMVAAAAATPMAERREAWTPRYSLRSTAVVKEKRKSLLPVPIMTVERSVGVTERKLGIRRNNNMKAY